MTCDQGMHVHVERVIKQAGYALGPCPALVMDSVAPFGAQGGEEALAGVAACLKGLHLRGDALEALLHQVRWAWRLALAASRPRSNVAAGRRRTPPFTASRCPRCP